MTTNQLVLIEARENDIREVSFEALALAQHLKQKEDSIVALVCSKLSQKQIETLGQHGATKVIQASHPQLEEYSTEAYRQVLLQIIDKEKPSRIIMGHTAIGKDLAPRLAMKLGAGLLSDITEVRGEDSEKPFFIRPIYSGKAFEEKQERSSPSFLTIRPNNFQSNCLENIQHPEVEDFEVQLKELRTEILETVKKMSSKVDLTAAKIVVAGGRGVKSEDGFKPLQELADVLGGAVGASRAACDAGYCDYGLQIGQTGKVITPTVYFAIGISGAIQHLAGMSQSKTIVAINKDPEAPIFEIADYGIVGDLFEVVPLLTEAFKKSADK
ncbi:electron transfer flavoprotein subunit alpha/FixB family protein [Alkalihalobacillus trypoxylicola]|uniref:Electron transfer flavoprotein subunit alpha n=1 Tax=Alkalihalobacillus trypoxylicola TaxID=519424 RepID=A0A161Q730_9BACI|nr:electron transfer flavoprotein subunit alpha/FixB family protein [Alkalihalobacillus trypoxylicola]KYG32238.1 electron transfer flavoprotein subunit alpha [Alkalihalobacillus trypoxylicola]